MRTYSVMDVSNFFVDYYKNSVDPMTLPRLQLFLYFAQAESLARNKRVLFNDEIRAYSTGPAVTRLYAYYEGAGNEQISVYKDYNVSIFDKEDRDLLMDVAVYYNQFSTSQLQIFTYVKGSPWAQVYCKYGDKMVAIEPKSIRQYYEQQPRVPTHMDFMISVLEMSGMSGSEINDALEVESSQVNTPEEITSSWE